MSIKSESNSVKKEKRNVKHKAKLRAMSKPKVSATNKSSARFGNMTRRGTSAISKNTSPRFSNSRASSGAQNKSRH